MVDTWSCSKKSFITDMSSPPEADEASQWSISIEIPPSHFVRSRNDNRLRFFLDSTTSEGPVGEPAFFIYVVLSL